MSDDRAKLKSKIDQDEQLKVLERPDMGSFPIVKTPKSLSSSVFSDSMLVEEAALPPNTNLLKQQQIVTIPPALTNHYPRIVGGDDPDPEVREKRDKVKEVSETVR